LVAKLLTDMPGASEYFLGSVVSYSNAVKQSAVGVRGDSLAVHGAVSEQVAREMAEGGRNTLATDYCVSVTGIAGPHGGTAEKPVGLVYISIAGPAGVAVREFHFGSDWPREAIRMRTALMALDLLRRTLLQAG
jgi:nicotinamide-nucleotide amidase